MTIGDGQRPGRRIWFLAVVAAAIVVGLVGGTWMLASRFQSPAQREAAALPPSAQPVLTAVTTGDLRDDFTVNGVLGSQEPNTVGFGVSGGTVVVTALGKGIGVGLPVVGGRVLLWGGDRPVIALAGAFPAYRELKIGDSGRDVVQLQNALNALGYGLSVDGQLGTGTMGAVADVYKANGAALTKVKVEQESVGLDVGQSGAAPKKNAPVYEQVILPSELCFIPGLGRGLVLEEVPGVGEFLDGATAKIKVATSETKLSADVPGQAAMSLTPGLEAKVANGAETVDLVIESVTPIKPEEDAEGGGDPEPAGDEATAVRLVFVPAKGSLPNDLPLGKKLLITVSRITPVKDSLIVPKRAITSAPDGKTSVLKQTADQTFVPVAVKELACVSGECAVEAQDSALVVGDMIRVDTP